MAQGEPKRGPDLSGLNYCAKCECYFQPDRPRSCNCYPASTADTVAPVQHHHHYYWWPVYQPAYTPIYTPTSVPAPNTWGTITVGPLTSGDFTVSGSDCIGVATGTSLTWSSATSN